MSKHGLFKAVKRHDLGQEYYAYLEKHDYAVAKSVSDCFVVAVHFRERGGRRRLCVGHFALRNLVQPSESFRGFIQMVYQHDVTSVAYATNYDYDKKTLIELAKLLTANTTLCPEDVHAFKLQPTLAPLYYRPIIYFARSRVFFSVGDHSLALDKDLKTNLQAIKYPKLRQSLGCSIL